MQHNAMSSDQCLQARCVGMIWLVESRQGQVIGDCTPFRVPTVKGSLTELTGMTGSSRSSSEKGSSLLSICIPSGSFPVCSTPGLTSVWMALTETLIWSMTVASERHQQQQGHPQHQACIQGIDVQMRSRTDSADKYCL